ncbi:terpene cyclase [Favolaschia claudopus]|uniref:Terpene synthase n=1 Tax=Favolaschia claudopus TaxID=2862362 RepID=A0AAW0A1S6_9AGAR
MSVPLRLRIPDLLANWPWPRTINPNYAACRQESQAWCSSFNIIPPRAQKVLNLCDPSLLGALAYPTVNYEQCRVVCDLFHVYGIFDDSSDAMDPTAIQAWVDIIMDALRNPYSLRPSGEPVIGEFIRSFWSNAVKVISTSAQQRFIDEFDRYTKAVVEQACTRDPLVLHDLESYMALRRGNVGAQPAFALLCMETDIAEDIYKNDALLALRRYAVDILCIANDLYSFNIEQAKGDDHNLVTLMVLHKSMNVQQAIDYVSTLHERLVTQFLSISQGLPSFGSPEVDDLVRSYVDALGFWIRANDCWSFESWRYFKDDGPRIQKERVVDLLPRRSELPTIISAV